MQTLSIWLGLVWSRAEGQEIHCSVYVFAIVVGIVSKRGARSLVLPCYPLLDQP